MPRRRARFAPLRMFGPRRSRTRRSTGSRSRHFCSARREPPRRRPCLRSSIRTAAPRATTATSGTATRSTSSTRATRGSRSTSAARPATGATSSGSNHGDWGVGDTKDCLAAADFLHTLDWVDGNRLGIFGSSYGSYLALLAVTDDRERRFRCAVAKYGDCDILTSWAQGDREGVQDMGRMMAHPSRDPGRLPCRLARPPARERRRTAPDRPRRARPCASARSSPRSSCRSYGDSAARRSSTSPTRPKAHGFLRAGPQLHFYRRLERFLDWYLM